MRPLRQNVALAIDGGGVKGVMVARALMRLEQVLGETIPERVKLVAGTSTGAVMAAGFAVGMDAKRVLALYREEAPRIFRKSLRTLPVVEYLVPFRYPSEPLVDALARHLGDVTLRELNQARPDFHMVVTATDILANATRFIKLYKRRYADWRLRDAVMASSVIPTVFPAFQHSRRALPGDPPEEDWIGEDRWWVDGGVGSYANPSFLAAYEIAFCLAGAGWQPANTTLISIGTGRNPEEQVWAARLRGLFGERRPDQLTGPEWALPAIGSFLRQADVQQARLVRHFFPALDFRRFNVDFESPIGADDVSAIDRLVEYGLKLGEMIVNDQQVDVGYYACGSPVPFSALPV